MGYVENRWLLESIHSLAAHSCKIYVQFAMTVLFLRVYKFCSLWYLVIRVHSLTLTVHHTRTSRIYEAGHKSLLLSIMFLAPSDSLIDFLFSYHLIPILVSWNVKKLTQQENNQHDLSSETFVTSVVKENVCSQAKPECPNEPKRSGEPSSYSPGVCPCSFQKSFSFQFTHIPLKYHFQFSRCHKCQNFIYRSTR